MERTGQDTFLTPHFYMASSSTIDLQIGPRPIVTDISFGRLGFKPEAQTVWASATKRREKRKER